MKITPRSLTLVAAASAVAAILSDATAARGGLIAAITYDEILNGSPGPLVPATNVTVAGTMLPVQQTSTLTAPAASAAYAFTDDGQTAALRVNAQAQLLSSGAVLGAGTTGDGFNGAGGTGVEGTYMTFAQPVTFTASVDIGGSVESSS